jgi:predicted nucleic-acid-binding Zn-ribbon protein
MKTYTFLVCRACGASEFADIAAASSAEAVRALVRKYPGCRANIINIY